MSKVKWFLIVLLAVGCLLAGNGLWNTNLPPLSNSAHKIVHVSFDDVVSVFKDLKKDSLSYVSIFEHAFLKELKNCMMNMGLVLVCMFLNGTGIFIFQRFLYDSGRSLEKMRIG